ncbi:MAG TPA: isoprenylcysteine carboxylmethyltransferase family protein [Candidatus Cybelea sp.]|nr:isoprenylcysteine carboxylmethyltransferase family protein [Candidatus Cybelea sp.]
MIGYDAGDLLEGAWIVFAVYWLVAALRRNPAKKREPAGEWLLRFAVMASAFILLYKADPRWGMLNDRFIPSVPWVRPLGAALAWIGIALAIWARHHIGRYWSGSVSLRTDHQLIRTGPYSRIRHPIYTGILMALAGTVLVIGRYRGLLAFALILAGFIWKSKREEKLLASEFGPAFEEHKRLTGFFLPRWSQPTGPRSGDSRP